MSCSLWPKSCNILIDPSHIRIHMDPLAAPLQPRFLFAGFTPLSIQVAIEKLEPITIRQSRRRSQSDARHGEDKLGHDGAMMGPLSLIPP